MRQLKKGKQYSICVVGAGHVGLVAAACFAQLGHKVTCVDQDRARIDALNKLRMPFFEPELEPLVKKNFKSKRLGFSSSLDKAVRDSQAIFIAVGTPPLANGAADLTAMENVARVVAQNLNDYKVIVEKSTVPVQTGVKIKETILRYRKNEIEFSVVSNPEFLREGKAVYDFFYPDRLVIGTDSPRALALLKDIYAPLKAQIVATDINTAELIKHASNSFLATKISFINAVSRVCDLAGADVRKVAEAMGMDKRIGRQFLDAGLGYGGFCFPKDLEAFIYISKKLGYDFGLLREVKQVNDSQRHYFVDKIKDHLWVLKGKKIAVWGVSFKPDTDDLRFAPSLDVVEYLVSEGADLAIYDPQAMKVAAMIFGKKVRFCRDPYSAAKDSDCICLLTEWRQFAGLDMAKVKKSMRYPLIADGRNFFDKEQLSALGFKYIGMGVK